MQRFTFKTHRTEDGHPQQDHILWELPAELRPHRDELVRQAGLRPKLIQEAGLLTEAWETHPKDAIILAPSLEFGAGQVFAVSREAVPAPL
jgi:hypothetical protein